MQKSHHQGGSRKHIPMGGQKINYLLAGFHQEATIGGKGEYR